MFISHSRFFYLFYLSIYKKRLCSLLTVIGALQIYLWWWWWWCRITFRLWSSSGRPMRCGAISCCRSVTRGSSDSDSSALPMSNIISVRTYQWRKHDHFCKTKTKTIFENSDLSCQLRAGPFHSNKDWIAVSKFTVSMVICYLIHASSNH